MREQLEQAIQLFIQSELIKMNIPIAFTEPLVLASKAKRVNENGGITIYWQNSVLLRASKNMVDDQETWIITDKDGSTLLEIK